MKRWLRRLRGALGIGLSWAVAWSGLGVVLMLAVLLITGSRPDPPVPMMFGVFGFGGGLIFSGVLSLLEGRRRLAEMSVARFAAWGGAAGLLLSTAFVLAVAAAGDASFVRYLLGLAPSFAVGGAGSAAGSLALARRAADSELLEDGEEILARSTLTPGPDAS